MIEAALAENVLRKPLAPILGFRPGYAGQADETECLRTRLVRRGATVVGNSLKRETEISPRICVRENMAGRSLCQPETR